MIIFFRPSLGVCSHGVRTIPECKYDIFQDRPWVYTHLVLELLLGVIMICLGLSLILFSQGIRTITRCNTNLFQDRPLMYAQMVLGLFLGVITICFRTVPGCMLTWHIMTIPGYNIMCFRTVPGCMLTWYKDYSWV